MKTRKIATSPRRAITPASQCNAPEPAYDLTGRVYGRWKVICFTGRWGRGKHSLWRCQCECGTVRDHVFYTSLTSNQCKSCGCHIKDRAAAKKKAAQERRETRSSTPKYHVTHPALYSIWRSMCSRCSNPKDRAYSNHGALGIKVHQPWVESFTRFMADMGERPFGLQLARKDPSGDFTPENCFWASSQERDLIKTAMAHNCDYLSLRKQVVSHGLTVEQGIAYCREHDLTYRERAKCRGGDHKPNPCWVRKKAK